VCYILIPVRDMAVVGDLARALEAGGPSEWEWGALARAFERTILTAELLVTYALAVAGSRMLRPLALTSTLSAAPRESTTHTMTRPRLVSSVIVLALVAAGVWRWHESRLSEVGVRIVGYGDDTSGLFSPEEAHYLALVPRQEWLDSLARPCASITALAKNGYMVGVRGEPTKGAHMIMASALISMGAVASALKQIRHDSIPLTPAGFSPPFRVKPNQFVLLASSFGPKAYVPVVVGERGEQAFLTTALNVHWCDPLKAASPPLTPSATGRSRVGTQR
jgi:hypothetical protein